MSAFIRNFRRIVAFLLVIILLPHSNVYAEENSAELTVTCCDIFRQDAISTTTVLETNSGYYITLQNALDMLGLKCIGDRYVSPNGLVSVSPDTQNLTKIVHHGDDWYALEQLMTQLDTNILAADGKLYYSCVPINQSLLQAETGRIMTADIYNAFFLEDLPGLSFLTAFAFTFNNLWNQPIDAITGKAYANDIGALFLEVLKHHEDNDSLARIMSQKLTGINEVRDLVLQEHKSLESIYEVAYSQMPGGGYLLFGIEGTGLLHEVMEANSMFAQMGLDVSDALGVIAQLHEMGKIPKLYVDALARIMNTASANNYSDAVILMQAERTMQIYNDYLEDNRAALVAEGLMMSTEDIAKNIITDGVLNKTLGGKLTKMAIEVLDTIPSNPFGNTFQKNKFVQNAALCVKLQTFFRNVYDSNNVSQCDGNAALILRDAAMLYLKTAWTAYDAAGFDKGIAGSVQRAKSLIDDELVLLTGFSDSMFYTYTNEPLTVGSLENTQTFNETIPTDKPSSGETSVVYPEGNWAADHTSYFAFLTADSYVDYISNPNIREACKVQYVDNYYTFRDLNSDGVDDLILWLGYTGADGEILTFTLDGGKIRYMGSAPCDGTGTHLFCADHDDDFYLASYTGEGLYADSYKIIRGSMQILSEDATIPHRWYVIDWIGSLPLTVTVTGKEPGASLSEKEPSSSPEEKEPDTPQKENDMTLAKDDWREFVSSDACKFYLENEVLFDYWSRDFLATNYWFEDIENNGTEELIVWIAGPNPPEGIMGEIMVFGEEKGQPVCIGNVAYPGRVSLSGHASLQGFLIVTNDGGFEKLALCRMEEHGLVVEENYMVTETGWYALEYESESASAPENN